MRTKLCESRGSQLSERRLLTREDAIRETINSPECLGYVKDLNDLQRKYLEATK